MIFLYRYSYIFSFFVNIYFILEIRYFYISYVDSQFLVWYAIRPIKPLIGLVNQ